MGGKFSGASSYALPQNDKTPSSTQLLQKIENKFQTSVVPHRHDKDDFVTSLEESNPLKHQEFIQSCVGILENYQFPSPSPTSKQPSLVFICKSLKNAIMAEAVSASGTTATSATFVTIAMALCKCISNRISCIADHQDVVKNIAFRANKIIERERAILAILCKSSGSDKTNKMIEPLLQHSFCAFCLIVDAVQRDPERGVSRLLNCKDLFGMLEAASFHLMHTTVVTSLIVRGNNNWKASRSISLENLPHAITHCRAVDACNFWSSSRFGSKEKVGITEFFRELDVWVAENGLISSGETLADNGRLYFEFAGMCNLEIVTAQKFNSILGSYNSVIEGVKNYNEPQPNYKNAITGSHEQEGNNPIMSFEQDLNVLLRKTLQPVSFGDDLIHHQQIFLKGTREWIFTEFESWASRQVGEGNHRVFWIKGSAGLGKSVIAAQLVKCYRKDHVGEDLSEVHSNNINCTNRSSSNLDTNACPVIHAYFFCKHDHAGLNNPRKAIATLAFRLASQHNGFANAFQALLRCPCHRKSLHAHAIGETGTVADAFHELFAKPLISALTTTSLNKHESDDVFILIDALDELQHGTSRQQLLRIFGKMLPSLPTNVRLIVTSRPDSDIVAFFKTLRPFVIEKQDELQRKDMEMYVRKEIFQETHLSLVDNETLKEDAVKRILDRADGVFLAVALVRIMVKENDLDCKNRENMSLDELDVVLGKSGSLVDRTLRDVMDRMVAHLSEMSEGDCDINLFLKMLLQDILSVLVASLEPLHLNDLYRLCSSYIIKGKFTMQGECFASHIITALVPLYSPSSQNSGIKPLHKTVVDFLTDPKRSGSYFVDICVGHSILARICLNVMVESGFLAGKQFLKKCALDDDHLLYYSLKYGHIHLSECISSVSISQTVDSCLAEKSVNIAKETIEQWASVFVVERTENEMAELGQSKRYHPSIYQASKMFATWLFAQIFTMKRRQEIVKELTWLSQSFQQSSLLLKFKEDSREQMFSSLVQDFALLYREHWAPAISDKDGLFAMKVHIPVTSCLMRSAGMTHLLKLCRITSFDLSLPLEVDMQRCMNTLTGHSDFVTSVTFIRNGTQIVSGSSDQMLRVWDAITGEVIDILQGHNRGIWSIASIEDGKKIVSGSLDGTISIWDGDTGNLMQILEGHGGSVFTVDVNHDGTRILSGYRDNTVKIWDVFSGQQINTLVGHKNTVISASFSRDGTRIISGSVDKTLKIWDAVTGEVINTLESHSAVVNSVAFNPDGTRIVSGSSDNTVKIWNTISGEVIDTLEGHSDFIRSVVFCPNGTTIISGSNDKTIKIWDNSTGKVIRTLKGHDSDIYSVAFSRDGRQILSGSGDKTVKIWDAMADEVTSKPEKVSHSYTSVAFNHNGTRIVIGGNSTTAIILDARSGDVIFTLEGRNLLFSSVAYSRDGSRIVSGGYEGTVMIWDAITGEVVTSSLGHNNIINTVAFNHDGTQIASGGDDKFVKIWNGETLGLIHSINGHCGLISSVAFNHNGERLVSASDRTLKIWNTKTGTIIKSLKKHDTLVSSVVFSQDGTKIVSGSWDKTIKIWDAKTGKVKRTLQGHSNCVSSVACSHNGNWIVSGSYDRTIKIWSAATGDVISTLEGHDDKIYKLALNHDMTKIASASADFTLKIWNPKLDTVLNTLTGHSGAVNSVSCSYDGSYVLTGSSDKTIRVWNVIAGKVTKILHGHSGCVNSVSFTQDGTQIVSGSDDNTVKIWDAIKGEVIITLKGHHGSIRCVASSMDEKKIATGSNDSTVKIWNAVTGDVMRTLQGHIGAVLSVHFSSNGMQLVTGSSNNELKLWNVVTGAEIALFKGHRGAVNSARFSPNARHIVSGSDDSTIKIWEAKKGDLLKTFKAHKCAVNSVVFNHDGTYIVSASRDRTIIVWDVAIGQVIKSLKVHSGGVNCITFNADESWIISVSDDKKVKILDCSL